MEKGSQTPMYSESVKLGETVVDKFRENQIEWIVNWLNSMHDAYLFTRRVSLLKPLAAKEFDEATKSRVINNKIKEPLHFLLIDLKNIRSLVEKINASNIDDGIETFYKSSIVKMVQKMKLNRLLEYASKFEYDPKSKPSYEFLDSENKLMFESVLEITEFLLDIE